MEAEAFLTFAHLFPQHLGWQGSPTAPTAVSTHLCKWFPKLDTLKSAPPQYSLLCSLMWETPDQSCLRRGGFAWAHGSRVWSIKMGTARWWDSETAGHSASTVRQLATVHLLSSGSRRGDTCAQLAFSFSFSLEANPCATTWSRLGTWCTYVRTKVQILRNSCKQKVSVITCL